MSEERAYWLAWSQISGIGPILLKRIEQHFGSLSVAWRSPLKAFLEVEGIGKKMLSVIADQRSQLNPELILEQYLEKNPHFWTPGDSNYPHLLLEIPSSPIALNYQGQVQLSENQGIKPMVGIVGTRYPTEYGRRWTRKISSILAQHGFTIVSGMAAGIDTEAHQACLQAGGRTIAVVGTGVDVVYPARNQKLYQAIQNQGLILSEYSAGTPPDKINFPARNRIIAGLSRAVLVMEAPIKSGALITAYFANEFGRDVYVLPGSLDDRESIGCLQLIDRGAHLILSEEGLLEMLGTIPKLKTPESTMFQTLEDASRQKQSSATSADLTALAASLKPELIKVLEKISIEPTPFDFIVQAIELDTNIVSAALLELELMGLISLLPGMRYQRL